MASPINPWFEATKTIVLTYAKWVFASLFLSALLFFNIALILFIAVLIKAIVA
jgi:hypothetical protein